MQVRHARSPVLRNLLFQVQVPAHRQRTPRQAQKSTFRNQGWMLLRTDESIIASGDSASALPYRTKYGGHDVGMTRIAFVAFFSQQAFVFERFTGLRGSKTYILLKIKLGQWNQVRHRFADQRPHLYALTVLVSCQRFQNSSSRLYHRSPRRFKAPSKYVVSETYHLSMSLYARR